MIHANFSSVASKYKYDVYFIVQNNPLMRGGMTAQDILFESLEKDINKIALHYSHDSLNTKTLQPRIRITKRQ